VYNIQYNGNYIISVERDEEFEYEGEGVGGVTPFNYIYEGDYAEIFEEENIDDFDFENIIRIEL